MQLNPLMALLGLSGGELIIILISLIVMFAVPAAAIVIGIWLWKRYGVSKNPVPPVMQAATKRICPQCRTEMAPDAPQGLCPQCLARAAFETQAGGAPQQQWTSALPISQIAGFFPQLEILELLGHGGMGVVYKARQPQLDRFVALKILAPELSRDPAFAERFTREARALARLNHPNIVAVYESGKAGDFYYLVMEFVDGLNLAQMQAAKKRLSPEEAFAIVPRICDALQYAHDEGVVHRDIKPANILVDKKGRVKIADFGLAKMAGREVTGLGLTQSRTMMGTPQYMAPEQLEKPLDVDHRADIYSLGVVFYEMLTGELPLGRFPVPSKKVQVDVRLDEIVLRTLEKEPELRYQQANQVKTAVETVVNTASAQTQSTESAAKESSDLSRPWWAQPGHDWAGDWEKWAKRRATPRFSRLAMIGVIWAVYLVVVLGPTAHVSSPVTSEPNFNFNLSVEGLRYWPMWMWALAVIMSLALLAPFGTTILGWIAVTQIRHSNGKLYGLGLAVFDGLVFPLLMLDAIIVFVPAKLMWFAAAGESARLLSLWTVIWTAVFAFMVAVDWFIVSRVWRAMKRPLALSERPVEKGPTAAPIS